MKPTACALALLAGLAGGSRAEVHVIRIATIVPDGTAYAREFRAFARNVETDTKGEVRVKIYFGGVAGDELQVFERLRRAQLDGVVSGGTVCERLAPSFHVMRIPGLFQSRSENGYVLGRLKPDLDKEFLAAGFINLIESGVGADIVFSRTPVSSMAELRKVKLWNWDLDQSLHPFLESMGMSLVRLPLGEAARAYDDHRADGFVSPANVALAWQWSAQVRYFTNINLSYVSGCFIIASRTFDALPIDAQKVIRTASAKTRERLDAVMQALDAQLLEGLFQKHGLTEVKVSSAFRAEFFEAARTARDRAMGKEIPRALVDRVQTLLADFRAAH